MSSAITTTCRRCETPLYGGRICSACKRRREAMRRAVGHVLAVVAIMLVYWVGHVLLWCVGGH